MITAWSFLLAAGGLLGIYLAGRKNLWGWAIGMAMQPLWVVFAIITDAWGLILNAVGYFTVYTNNYIKWRGEKRQKEKEDHG